MLFSHLKQWTLSSCCCPGTRPLDGHSPVEGSAQCHSNQQIMAGMVVKGEQDRTENMPLGKSTEHLPLGDSLEFWSFSEAQKSSREGQESSVASLGGMSRLAGEEGAGGCDRGWRAHQWHWGRGWGWVVWFLLQCKDQRHWMQLRTSTKRGFFAGHRAEPWKLLL